MPYPFYRTLKRFKERGFIKTASIIIAVCLRSLINLRYIPKRAIVKVNHYNMLLLPRKGAIHSDLFFYRKREPICTNFLMHSGIVKEGDVVLDIGANIGYYVLVEAQLVGNGGRVYASEPVSNNFELLKTNVKLNNFKNVEAFRFAFGEKDKKSKIFISNGSNLSAVNKNAVGGKIIGEEEVLMITVDTFLKNRELPNLIRMDVEGYESEIISGMPQTLKENIRILLELHPQFLSQKLDKIFQILAQNNFKVRFAVFEKKVEENRIVSYLMKKGGDTLPFVISDISIQEFKNLMDKNPVSCPSVVFEKCKEGRAR